jgi:myo-inositol-1(or 4)-monophosphatase
VSGGSGHGGGSELEESAPRASGAGGSGEGTGDSMEDLREWMRVGDSAQELLKLAASAAQGAGYYVLRDRFLHGGREQGVESKSTPTDLVSDADREAQRYIRELIAMRRPDDGFLGEEGGDDVQGTSGLRWVVDPLDGTINFLFGIPQWCVSVAVQDDRGTVAGAIWDSNSESLFKATRGGEATMTAPRTYPNDVPPPPDHAPREHDVRTLRGSECSELARAMVATGFAYDARVRAAQGEVLARVLPQVRDIRRFGSAALDLAWTAMGRYDAYFERTVKPWDIAAGTLLCEAAGLRVVELPEREDLPWGILVAPPALCEPLLELVG